MVENDRGKIIATDRSQGVETVIRERVQARTRELAVIAGRAAADVSQTDYEQAKRELAGEADRSRQDAAQSALLHRAQCNGLAARGKYSAEAEQETREAHR